MTINTNLPGPSGDLCLNIAADLDLLAVELEGLAAAVDEVLTDPAVALGFLGVRIDVGRAERGPFWDVLELGVAENLAENLMPAGAGPKVRPQHRSWRSR